MKKTIGILLFDEVEVLDFAGPFEVFSVASELKEYTLFDVFTFSKIKQPINAVNGLSVNPKYSFEEIPEIDLLVIPGGNGTKKLIEDQQVLDKLSSIIESSVLTMTVCSGSRVLAKLGLLAEKPFCTHFDVYEAIAELAPTANPKKSLRYVQSDDELYSSGGISAGIDLSFHLLEKIAGREVVETTARYMEYRLTDDQDNFIK